MEKMFRLMQKCKKNAHLRKIWMTMKLTMVFFFIAISQMMATESYSQSTRISLHLKDVKIKEVLNEIEESSEFRFLYNSRLVDVERTVSVDFNDQKITDILNKLFQETNFVYTVVDRQIVLTNKTDRNSFIGLNELQQGKTISGKVKDTSGSPLPGVSVIVKDSNKGTISDIDGNYALSGVPENTSLQFSFIGMKTQIVAIGGKSSINVTMIEESIGLDEVVAIGYGTQKKQDLTGSVATASNKVMKDNAVSGLGQALQGKLAGVQIQQQSGDPRAGVTIKIRGTGTFGANSSPLIVIDGIITNLGLTDLNYNSIEDVTILKDASSAAIYGSRGANGVVLVTTKRGSAQQHSFQFSSYYSFDNVQRINTPVDAVTYSHMVNEYFVNSGKEAPFSDSEIASYTKSTNWQDEIFRTGGKQNYELLATGGTKSNLYSVSLGYYKGDGIVINHTFDRYNLRVNNDITPFEGLKIGTGIGLSSGTVKQGNVNGAISEAMIYPSNIPAYLPNGNFAIASHVGHPVTMRSPLIEALMPQNKSIFNRALLNVFAEYNILRGLKFKSSIGLEFYNTNLTNFNPTYDYGTSNKNLTAQLTRQSNDNRNIQWDNILTYSKVLNVNHVFDILAGYSYQTTRDEYFSGYREGFSSNDVSQQILNSGSKNDQARGYYSIWALQSYFGRLNYSYKGKYLLTSNVRVDQSSRFPKTNRTGIFPSFSAGWVLSNENFIKGNLGLISFMKLRGSYGFIGNQDIGVYPYQSTLNSSQFYSFGTGQKVATGTAPVNNVNPDITWEKTASTDIGGEVRFLNDKLSINADYYNKITSDILVSVPLPSLSGRYGNPYQNIGKLRNRGFEFTVGYSTLSEKKDFTYEIGLNFTTNKNKVVKLSTDATIINQGGNQAQYEYRTEEGHEINEYYGYVMEGIFQTKEEIANWATQPNAAPGDMKFKDLNNDGVINSLDRKYIGSSLTQKMFGANGLVKYKNFDLSMSLNGEFGRSMYILTNGFNLVRMGEITSAMYYDRWTGPGTSNYVPRLVAGDPNNNSRMSTFWLRSQDYVRIQNVQLGYNFNSILINKIKLQNLRLYIAAQNLYTFTSFPGYDPELGTNTYPIPRSIYFGINIGF